MHYLQSVRAVVLGIIALVAGTIAAVTIQSDTPREVAMRLSPESAHVSVGQTITFDVIVASPIPVNVFTGEVVFDSDTFAVSAITYNTSIADLWVNEPWYSRSDNSVYFAGGTTVRGGFVGQGRLLSVTLEAVQPGNVDVALQNVRILKHDGIGSDADVAPSLESVFTATGSTSLEYRAPQDRFSGVTVATEAPSPDLNNDGVVSFLDIGTLLRNLGSDDPRYDLNQDGNVNTRDFAVIQAAR